MTTANKPLDVALSYIAMSWPVFPCRNADEVSDEYDTETGEVVVFKAKTPLLSNGFRGATLSERIVRELWSRNPEAAVGIPTGSKTNVFVLDIDVKSGVNGFDWLREQESLRGDLPKTATASTPSGGVHYYFKYVENTRNRGALGAGVDIRSEGGYVLAPGSVMATGKSYQWLDFDGDGVPEIADAPQWLLDLVVRKQPASTTSSAPRVGELNSAYVSSAVQSELDDLALAPMGSRNNSLNDSAFALGTFVGAGGLLEHQARSMLQDVARGWGRDWALCCKTIESGLKAGIAAPRVIPEPAYDIDIPTDPEVVRRVIENGMAKAVVPSADDAANDNEAQPSTKPKSGSGACYPGLTHSGDFVRGFVPPDYHIDGIAQAGFLYSTTAMTGTGKTAWLLQVSAQTMLGGKLADRDVRKGRVIYFVGENPDDVRMRWIAMAHAMEFDPSDADVYFMLGAFSIPEMFFRIKEDVGRLGGAEMIVIDTSAAYFQGDDDNSNTQLGNHARDLRQLTTLKGRPAVFVASHPVKNADTSNLLPRGGGAFLNEVDGNFTLVKKLDIVEFHWQGKHRGPDFEPIHFALKPTTTPGLVDSKGRPIPSVMAECVDPGDVRKAERQTHTDADSVLLEIDRAPQQSLNEIADSLGWRAKSGDPDKERARRAVGRLERDKLMASNPGGRGRKLTKAGRDALADARAERFRADRDARVATNVVTTARNSRVSDRVEHESEKHEDMAA